MANLLGRSKEAFSERKWINSIPIDKLDIFCERESINIDWLLYGECPKYREERREVIYEKGREVAVKEPSAECEDKKLFDLMEKVARIYKEDDLS
ncbi:MAG: hypothetical protein HYV59_12575 [Planctomycetes bacterium]|nr:hypothetical protein [Planctomycetota bacterium]